MLEQACGVRGPVPDAADGRGDALAVASAHLVLAEALLEGGDPDAALESVRSGIEFVGARDLPRIRGRLWLLRAEIEADSEALDRARRLLERAEDREGVALSNTLRPGGAGSRHGRSRAIGEWSAIATASGDRPEPGMPGGVGRTLGLVRRARVWRESRIGFQRFGPVRRPMNGSIEAPERPGVVMLGVVFFVVNAVAEPPDPPGPPESTVSVEATRLAQLLALEENLSAVCATLPSESAATVDVDASTKSDPDGRTRTPDGESETAVGDGESSIDSGGDPDGTEVVPLRVNIPPEVHATWFELNCPSGFRERARFRSGQATLKNAPEEWCRMTFGGGLLVAKVHTSADKRTYNCSRQGTGGLVCQ